MPSPPTAGDTTNRKARRPYIAAAGRDSETHVFVVKTLINTYDAAAYIGRA